MENNLSIVKDQFKELPNNIEAEQAVIGSILVSNEIFDEINTIISSVNFYDPMHQKIFEAVESLIYKGMLANPITLKNFFEKDNMLNEVGGTEYLVKLTRFSGSAKQAIDYAKIIHEMYLRRELVSISEKLSYDTLNASKQEQNAENIIESTADLCKISNVLRLRFIRIPIMRPNMVIEAKNIFFNYSSCDSPRYGCSCFICFSCFVESISVNIFNRCRKSNDFTFIGVFYSILW